MAGSVGQYSIGWFPWQANYSMTGFTRYNSAADLGMGFFYSGAQNDQFTTNCWVDTGTWKIAFVYATGADHGIATFNFDGVSQGTKDLYSVGNIANNYAEITGLTVAAAKVVAFQVIGATKNGSSSGYRVDFNSVALIRTSGTASTPGGTDTPGYTWQHFWWMGEKTTSTAITRTQTSSGFGGGYANHNVGIQNDYRETDIWLDSGTFKYAEIHLQNTDRGIASVRLDGSEKATIDHYGAYDGGVGTYAEVTGISLSAPTAARAFRLQMATKNASSSGYQSGYYSSTWVRTGA